MCAGEWVGGCKAWARTPTSADRCRSPGGVAAFSIASVKAFTARPAARAHSVGTSTAGAGEPARAAAAEAARGERGGEKETGVGAAEGQGQGVRPVGVRVCRWVGWGGCVRVLSPARLTSTSAAKKRHMSRGTERGRTAMEFGRTRKTPMLVPTAWWRPGDREGEI